MAILKELRRYSSQKSIRGLSHFDIKVILDKKQD